jgi:predicted acyltransferase
VPRDLRIDRLRGVLVVLMVAGNFGSGVAFVPAFLKHAPDVGLTVADLVAPCFVFAIGLNFRPSFIRHSTTSAAAAYRHFLLRYLSLLGIGAILSAGGTVVAGQPSDWGVLQALGLAGLVSLLVVRWGTVARLAAGLVLLLAYQYMVDAFALRTVLASVQGGFLGSLSWGALLILSTAAADVWRKGIVPYSLMCAALAAIAVASTLLWPVSKNRVSASYILISLAVSAVAFLLIDLGSRTAPRYPGVFCWWGENALALYLLHLLLLALVVLPGVPGWYADAPAWLALLELAVILAVLTTVAWWLHRRRIRIGL